MCYVVRGENQRHEIYECNIYVAGLKTNQHVIRIRYGVNSFLIRKYRLYDLYKKKIRSITK